MKVGQSGVPTVKYYVNDVEKLGQDAAGKYKFSLVNNADSAYVDLDPDSGRITGLKVSNKPGEGNTVTVRCETQGQNKAHVDIDIYVVNPTEAPAPVTP